MSYRRIGHKHYGFKPKPNNSSNEYREWHYRLPDGTEGTYYGTRKGFNRLREKYKNEVITHS